MRRKHEQYAGDTLLSFDSATGDFLFNLSVFY